MRDYNRAKVYIAGVILFIAGVVYFRAPEFSKAGLPTAEPDEAAAVPADEAPAHFLADVAADKKRSEQWETFARKCKGEHPQCAYCGLIGTDKTIEAHHKHAFELMTPAQRGTSAPGGELDPDNIILLCRPDHLKYGHLGNFKNSDPDIEAVCKKHEAELKSRGEWGVKNESRP